MTEVALLVGSALTQGVGLAATRASDGLRLPWWVVVAFVAMGLSVMLMSRAIAEGLPLAVAYGVWSGAGIVLATVTVVLVFHDRPRRVHLFGLVLVTAGVAAVYAAG